jgi:hypothetical protein
VANFVMFSKVSFGLKHSCYSILYLAPWQCLMTSSVTNVHYLKIFKNIAQQCIQNYAWKYGPDFLPCFWFTFNSFSAKHVHERNN